MTVQELRKILGVDDEANKDKCTQFIQNNIDQNEILNRIAALGVMGFEVSTMGKYPSYGRMQTNGVFKVYCRVCEYNPCTNSNQFDELAKQLQETTDYYLCRGYYWHPEGCYFQLYQGNENLIEEKPSPDNSAGVTLCIIAVIECVFAQVESPKESE